MEDRVPVTEWTDDEWLEVIRRVNPEAHFTEAEKLVAKLRREKGEAKHHNIFEEPDAT